MASLKGRGYRVGLRRLFLNALSIVSRRTILSDRSLAFQPRQRPDPLPTVSSFEYVQVLSPREKIIVSQSTPASCGQVTGFALDGSLTLKQLASLPMIVPKPIHRRTRGTITNVVVSPSNIYHFYLHNLLPYCLARDAGLLSPTSNFAALDVPSVYQRKERCGKNLMSLTSPMSFFSAALNTFDIAKQGNVYLRASTKIVSLVVIESTWPAKQGSPQIRTKYQGLQVNMDIKLCTLRIILPFSRSR